MASLRNLNKARQRQHKERGQPEARAQYGLLEKKKDYKQRANDYHKKQNTITALKRKAQNRNPDEFYFKMVKTQKVDGVHSMKASTEPAYTDEQIKLMRSQDIRYVNHKRSVELKKIERLKSELHLIDGEDKPKNKHTIFVDTKKEAKEFDAAKYFDTHPSLVNRAYNRPTMETLRKADLSEGLDDETINRFAAHRLQRYKELTKRIRRAKELGVIAQKMQTAKHLLDKTSQKKKMSKETKQAAAQYKWEFKRKR